MLAELWHQYLFAPLLNLLIWLYNGPAFGNLGLAVVYMTIGLRIVLIPFSVISERNGFKYEKIQEDVVAIQKEFKDDPVVRKEHLRELMRANKIQPWAAVILLGMQLLALVILYQVFVGGMSGKLSALYPSIARPDVINTNFLGLDIAERNWWAAGLVGLIVYWQVWRDQRRRREMLERNDIIFRYAFPLFAFGALAILPSVKTVFILTAIAFGYIIHLLRPFFTRRIQAVKHTALRIHEKLTTVGQEKPATHH